MADFEIDGHSYRSGQMPAKTQFHVLRRLAPVLSSLKDLSGLTGGNAETMAASLGPITEAIAKLSDADTEYVLDACLEVTERQQGAGWAKVQTKGARRPMFDDINFAVMLKIAMAVMQDNFSSFFPASLSGSVGEARN